MSYEGIEAKLREHEDNCKNNADALERAWNTVMKKKRKDEE